MFGEFVDWRIRAADAGARIAAVPEIVLWRRLHAANTVVTDATRMATMRGSSRPRSIAAGRQPQPRRARAATARKSDRGEPSTRRTSQQNLVWPTMPCP